MFPSVAPALRAVRAVAASVEPDALRPGEAAAVAAELMDVIRVASAALTIVADRAGESSRWRAEGKRSVTAWVADGTGLGWGVAEKLVDTSRRLRANPGGTLAKLQNDRCTALKALEALKARDVAAEAHRRAAEEARRQAEEEAGADAQPVCGPHQPEGRSSSEIEDDLLELAERASLEQLRDEARRQRAAAADAEQRRKSQLLYRYWREQHHDDGSLGGQYKLPPEQAALVHAMLREEAEAIAKARREQGLRELPYEAYLADAFLSLLGIALAEEAATPTQTGSAPEPDATPTGPARTSKPAATGPTADPPTNARPAATSRTGPEAAPGQAGAGDAAATRPSPQAGSTKTGSARTSTTAPTGPTTDPPTNARPATTSRTGTGAAPASAWPIGDDPAQARAGNAAGTRPSHPQAGPTKTGSQRTSTTAPTGPTADPSTHARAGTTSGAGTEAGAGPSQPEAADGRSTPPSKSEPAGRTDDDLSNARSRTGGPRPAATPARPIPDVRPHASAAPPKDRPKRPAPKLRARISSGALRRGTTVPGEVCEVRSNGPATAIRVASLRALLAHSNLFVVVHDDERCVSVTHVGRKRPPGTPAHLRPDGQPVVARVRGILRVHVRDLAAHRGGLTADVAGVGVVSLDALEQLLGPRLAQLVERRAVNVQSATTTARDFPCEVKVAAEEDQPLCVDCGSPFNLEHDHEVPHSMNGPSSLANDAQRCRPCHREKTQREAAQTIHAGLVRKRAQEALLRAGPPP